MSGKLDLGTGILESKLTVTGDEYYDLSHLCSDPDVKVLAFIQPNSFTFQRSEPIRAVTYVSKQAYLRYRKPEKWTMVAKANAKDLISFNLFYVASGKLLNKSLETHSLAWIEREGLAEVYLTLMRQLHGRVAGHPIAESAQLRLRDKRGLIEPHEILSSDTLQMDLLAYMYPALAEYMSRSESIGSLKEAKRHRTAFPAAFTPYLREPSWDRLLAKLFGTRLPQAVREGLQPENAPIARLAGAFLVRSLVPASELLDFEIEPHPKDRQSYLALTEVRRILRAVAPENRTALLKTLRDNPSRRFYELAGSISDPLRWASKGERKYELSGFSNVRTWVELRAQAAYTYAGQADLRLSHKQQRAEKVQAIVNAAFTSLGGTHPIEVGKGSLQARSMHGEPVHMISITTTQVMFAFQLANPGALPRNSALRSLAQQLRREGFGKARSPRVLKLHEGEVLLQKLVEALNRMLTRHRLALTPRNRTRLLVALTMFGESNLKSQSAMPRSLWELIESELDMVEVYYGLILDATVAEVKDLMKISAHTRLALTEYDPAAAPHR